MLTGYLLWVIVNPIVFLIFSDSVIKTISDLPSLIKASIEISCPSMNSSIIAVWDLLNDRASWIFIIPSPTEYIFFFFF